ncbi:UNVERIFIED_CONTAM: hypothetical protein K2H54_002850 [Gekko kuhli]
MHLIRRSPSSTAQGKKPPDGDAVTREEQDDNGGDEGKRHGRCSAPRLRPREDGSAREALGTPEMMASGSGRPKTPRGDAAAKGTSAPEACGVGAWLAAAASVWFPLKGGRAGGRSGSQGAKGAIRGEAGKRPRRRIAGLAGDAESQREKGTRAHRKVGAEARTRTGKREEVSPLNTPSF